MIVCATRGGEGSRALIRAAIEEAKTTDTALLFLFVANANAFAEDSLALDEFMKEELLWLGGVVLRLMQLRAREAGVSADIEIIEGNVSDSIISFVQKHEVTTLFVGAPYGITTDMFGDDEIERFGMRIESETNVPVKIIHAPNSSKKKRK